MWKDTSGAGEGRSNHTLVWKGPQMSPLVLLSLYCFILSCLVLLLSILCCLVMLCWVLLCSVVSCSLEFCCVLLCCAGLRFTVFCSRLLGFVLWLFIAFITQAVQMHSGAVKIDRSTVLSFTVSTAKDLHKTLPLRQLQPASQTEKKTHTHL